MDIVAETACSWLQRIDEPRPVGPGLGRDMG